MSYAFRRIPSASIAFVLILTCLLGCTGAVQADNQSPDLKGPRKSTHFDLGVDTAMVKTQTILFTNPDIASAKIGVLRRSELMVLVSREKWNGWYRVIQYSSGHQGWVVANRLHEPEYTKHRNPGLTLSSTPTSANTSPVMELNNDTDYNLYLHIDTLSEITIKPHTIKPLVVRAGIFSFNAAVPDHTPNFGYMAFLSGSKYPWRFYVSHTHEFSPQPLVTPQMIANYNIKIADVDAKKAEAKIEKKQIEDDRYALQKQGDVVKAEMDNIDAKRALLNRSDQKAVDDFNGLVVSSNNDSDFYQNARREFNAKVDTYNSLCDALSAEDQQLYTLEGAVNNPR